MPSNEIQKSRQIGLCNIDSLTNEVDYSYVPIKKNQYEPEGRLILSRTQIGKIDQKYWKRRCRK